MTTYEYDRPGDVMRKEIDKVNDQSRKNFKKRENEFRAKQEEIRRESLVPRKTYFT